MASPRKNYEFRCPVYGFVNLSDWERDIVNHRAFQRLRRIRQLAWTDYVYPGAMHTRFEHSLGVMNMATMIFDGSIKNSSDYLQNELRYTDSGLERTRVLLRISALVHDIGHSPFSHATEELFPSRPGANTPYKHENYSAAIVRFLLKDVIEQHPLNTSNYQISAEDVASFLEGTSTIGGALLWRDIIDGQMDADRMDYLLRDSLHLGVRYGSYDWQRLVNTVTVIPPVSDESPRLGVNEGGWHAAEGLILARYFMFTQVYFHKTRIAYDYHLQNALSEMLPNGKFPTPDPMGIQNYLEWDDWRVLGNLSNGDGGEHGERIASRDHYREIVHTPETPKQEDFDDLDKWRKQLGDLVAAEISADKSWYRLESNDIPVLSEIGVSRVKPLSWYSSAIRNMSPIEQISLFAKPEHVGEARRLVGGA